MASKIYLQQIAPATVTAPVTARLSSPAETVIATRPAVDEGGGLFSLDFTTQPEAVNVDPGYTILWEDSLGLQWGHPCQVYWNGTDVSDQPPAAQGQASEIQ